MADAFQTVLGVDASSVMVSKARELNASIEGLSFQVLGTAGLTAYPNRAFDLVYSRLVLQHITDGDLIRRTVASLVRLVAEGGLLVLQVPAWIPQQRRLQARPRLYSLLRAAGLSEAILYGRLGLHPIRMNAMEEDTIIAIVNQQGGQMLDIERSRLGTPPIEDRVYWVTRDR